jgi:hypothetical protein
MLMSAAVVAITRTRTEAALTQQLRNASLRSSFYVFFPRSELNEFMMWRSHSFFPVFRFWKLETHFSDVMYAMGRDY